MVDVRGWLRGLERVVEWCDREVGMCVTVRFVGWDESALFLPPSSLSSSTPPSLLPMMEMETTRRSHLIETRRPKSYSTLLDQRGQRVKMLHKGLCEGVILKGHLIHRNEEIIRRNRLDKTGFRGWLIGYIFKRKCVSVVVNV